MVRHRGQWPLPLIGCPVRELDGDGYDRAVPRSLLIALGVLASWPTAALGTPVVWVQAGHEGPREPGYVAQTGAGSGPFGSEVAFTTRTADRVVAILRARGVDARRTPGRVTPFGARGATFVSIHHDAPGGAAALGHAVTGGGENYYRGEGTGEASPTPYPDSAPHRAALPVSPAVERRSRALAVRLAAALRGIHTPPNGAQARFAGVVARTGNRRMMHFYGYYRTRADARVLIECGAAGADDAFLSRTDLVARTIATALVTDLRARGQLG